MAIDPRTVRLAIVGRWIELLFAKEAEAAANYSRHAEPWDNGPDEAARLRRLRGAWRARQLVMLGIADGSEASQKLDATARVLWNGP